MSTSLILERIAADGLTLYISEGGNLDIVGDQSAVDSWLETIRQNKAAILFELRDKRVQKMLQSDPERKCALLVHDASTDPVLVTVGVRGVAIFDLQIPQAHYNGLIEVLEQYCDSMAGEKAA